MKKILLLILTYGIVLSACQKDNASAPLSDAQKYKVSFVVAGESDLFSKSGSTISAAGDTLNNHANMLYYYVYNSSGVFVKKMTQTSSMPNFGTVTDSLPTGNYSIFMLATHAEIALVEESSFSTVAFGHNSYFPFGDAFLKSFQLTIGTQNVNQTVRLDRVVGGLEITILDEIPANAAYIDIALWNDANSYSISQGVSSGTYHSGARFTLTASDKGQKNRKFLFHVLNTHSPIPEIKIYAKDAQNQQIAFKKVNDVWFYKNKKTSLSGNLFPQTATPESSFSVVVNPTWDSAPGPAVTF
ncbi:FimB/Mfa2 family fimbrial subunit [Paradesertivirga mongoliensis]|uniref:FimB/Mfa2 family fimbrial subunit n=1 Tax=Paradesertivirga mongoliensis TaxID=2100740 RepID=A0ABW4ZRB4_9SPHI|nr:FimB/Mfa2 family fimbrial subunit [Pedobacter mongoliensis]